MVDDLFDQTRSQYVTGTYNQIEYETGAPGGAHEWSFTTASISYVITGTSNHSLMTGSRFTLIAQHPQSGEKTSLKVDENGDGQIDGIVDIDYGTPEDSFNWSLKNHPQSALDPSFALFPSLDRISPA